MTVNHPFMMRICMIHDYSIVKYICLTQTWSTNQCLFSPGRFSIGPRCTPRHAAVPHASSSLPPSSLREPPSWTACVTASIESAEDFSTACTSRPTPRRHEPRRPIAAHVINVPPSRAPSRRPCQLWSRALSTSPYERAPLPHPSQILAPFILPRLQNSHSPC